MRSTQNGTAGLNWIKREERSDCQVKGQNRGGRATNMMEKEHRRKWGCSVTQKRDSEPEQAKRWEER